MPSYSKYFLDLSENSNVFAFDVAIGFLLIIRLDKTNKMSVRPAKTQISLGIRPVWSESSLCAQRIAKGPRFLHADSESSDQTGRTPRLIWAFAGRTLTLLVLSCRGSHIKSLALRRSTPLLAAAPTCDQHDYVILCNSHQNLSREQPSISLSVIHSETGPIINRGNA